MLALAVLPTCFSCGFSVRASRDQPPGIAARAACPGRSASHRRRAPPGRRSPPESRPAVTTTFPATGDRSVGRFASARSDMDQQRAGLIRGWPCRRRLVEPPSRLLLVPASSPRRIRRGRRRPSTPLELDPPMLQKRPGSSQEARRASPSPRPASQARPERAPEGYSGVFLTVLGKTRGKDRSIGTRKRRSSGRPRDTSSADRSRRASRLVQGASAASGSAARATTPSCSGRSSGTSASRARACVTVAGVLTRTPHSARWRRS